MQMQNENVHAIGFFDARLENQTQFYNASAYRIMQQLQGSTTQLKTIFLQVTFS